MARRRRCESLISLVFLLGANAGTYVSISQLRVVWARGAIRNASDRRVKNKRDIANVNIDARTLEMVFASQ